MGAETGRKKRLCPKRLLEIAALVVVSLSLIGLCLYMVHLDRMGEAFGTAIGALITVVSAIRNVGQGQAMQAALDHLAQSQPVKPGDDTKEL